MTTFALDAWSCRNGGDVAGAGGVGGGVTAALKESVEYWNWTFEQVHISTSHVLVNFMNLSRRFQLI